MAFLKANLILILAGVVALSAVGGGVLAIMSSEEADARMKEVHGLVRNLQSLQRKAANEETITAKAEEIAQKKLRFDSTMERALAMQKYNAFYEQVDSGGKATRVERAPLVADALPDAKKPGPKVDFQQRYRTAFKKLAERLHGRDKPTTVEILRHERHMELKKGQSEDDRAKGPWVPALTKREDGTDDAAEGKERSLADLLRESANASAADEVARSIQMYVDEGALGIHDVATATTTLTATEIWQAQMGLWIEQDIVTGLARCNEARAAALEAEGVPGPYWVADMPVKRLAKLCIDDVLGDGGGLNRCSFAESFTGKQNNEKMFVVQVQLHLVIEAAALTDVLEKLCDIGFYTVVNVDYRAVKPDPTFTGDSGGARDISHHLYIYGEDPVIYVTIDLEGYFFREVFEAWIPKGLKEALAKDGARTTKGPG